MLRRSVSLLTAAASSSPSSSSTNASRAALTARFESWVQNDCLATYQDNVHVQLDDTLSRGLIAKRSFRQGVTLLSIPMAKAAITADKLLANSPFVQSACTPTFSDIRKVLMTLSVLDPVLHQQIYCATVLAAERMNPNSFYSPYFDILPHPAIDDQAVMTLHKDVLDPMQLIEWDDHQRLFLTAARELHAIWEKRIQRKGHAAAPRQTEAGNGKPVTDEMTAAPPVQVIYWAIRTVLSRMHQLPDRGLMPANSKLDFASVSTLALLESQQNMFRRFYMSIKGMLLEQGENAALQYRLVPTLIPLVDLTGHLPSGNVAVEVQPRAEVGSCVELQAVTDIQEGEPVGLCWNKSQSVAFTLYRFGFLPM